MSKRRHQEVIYENGGSVAKKSRKKNVAAFIICVLIAFVIWLYASNTEEKDKADEETDSVISNIADEAMRDMSALYDSVVIYSDI